MNRRHFLGLGAGLARGQQKQRQETVVAAASRVSTRRVGIVTSNFLGSEDHDGTKVSGLADPQPMSADLTQAQIGAMVVKALELGSPVKGGLGSIFGPEDWVVIKSNIVSCYGLGPETHDGGAHHPYLAGTVTDLRVIQALIEYLAEHQYGARIRSRRDRGNGCRWSDRNRRSMAGRRIGVAPLEASATKR